MTLVSLANRALQGDERAENKFYDVVVSQLTYEQEEGFEEYCLKATLEERLAKGMELAA